MKIPTFPTIHWEEAAIPLTNSEVWGGERVRGVPVLTDDSGVLPCWQLFWQRPLVQVILQIVGVKTTLIRPEWFPTAAQQSRDINREKREKSISLDGMAFINNSERLSLTYFVGSVWQNSSGVQL